MSPTSLSVAPEVYKSAWGVVGITVFLVGWIIRNGFNNQAVIIKTYFYYPIIGFILWCIVSLVWVVDGYLASIQLIQFTSVGLVFFIVLNSIRNGADVKKLLLLIVLVSVAVSVLGLLQHYFPNNSDIQTFIRQMAVPASTFGNRNMATHYIVMTLPLSMIFFLEARTILKSAFFTTTILICGLFLLHSNTRAGWLSVIAEVSFLTLFLVYDFLKNRNNPFMINGSQHRSLFLGILLLISIILFSMTSYRQEGWVQLLYGLLVLFCVIVIFLLQYNNKLIKFQKVIFIIIVMFMLGTVSSFKGFEPSITKFNDRFASISYHANNISENGRFAGWRNTLELIKDHPVRGVGVGQWSTYYPLYYDRIVKDQNFNEKIRFRHLHNEYLELYSNVGIFGAFFLLWLFILSVNVSYKTLVNVQSENRYLVLGMVLALTGFAVISMFSFPVKVYYPMLLVMVYIALNANIFYRNTYALDMSGGSYKTKIDGASCSDHSFVLGKIYSIVLLGFSILFAVATSVVSYRWLMGEHYFNLTRDIELTQYDDLSEKSLLKLQTIEKSIILNPSNPRAQFVAGQVLIENKHLDEGIKYIEKSLKKSPYQSLRLDTLFLAYATKKDLKNMLKVVEKYIEVDPRSVRAYAYATATYRELGRIKDAKVVYQKMKKNYSYFKARKGFGPYYDEVGGTALAVGDIEYAKQVFSEAVKEHANDAFYHKKLGGLYFLYPKNKDEKVRGVDLIKRALKLDPKVSGSGELKKLINEFKQNAK